MAGIRAGDKEGGMLGGIRLPGSVTPNQVTPYAYQPTRTSLVCTYQPRHISLVCTYQPTRISLVCADQPTRISLVCADEFTRHVVLAWRMGWSRCTGAKSWLSEAFGSGPPPEGTAYPSVDSRKLPDLDGMGHVSKARLEAEAALDAAIADNDEHAVEAAIQQLQ
eukprot:2703778-Rhodomonas_salina.1